MAESSQISLGSGNDLTVYLSKMQDEEKQNISNALGEILKVSSDSGSSLDLQQFSLTDFQFSTMSEPILKMKDHLKELNLFFNELTSVPSWIGELVNLETLHLGCNPLVEIDPAIFQKLTKLQVLDIGYGEQLKKIPDSIGMLKSLRVLWAGNNQLESVPESIGELENLEELYLYGNRITSIPQSISRLQRLKIINVGRNILQELPVTLGDISGLVELHAYENDLQALPASLGSLPGLKVLNILNNAGLRTPPTEVQAQGVQALIEFYSSSSLS